MSKLHITIDLDSEVPFDEQFKRQIERKLELWLCKPGQRLPTVRQLALELEINANTVSGICRRLTEDGYLVRREGIGTYAVALKKEDAA